MAASYAGPGQYRVLEPDHAWVTRYTVTGRALQEYAQKSYRFSAAPTMYLFASAPLIALKCTYEASFSAPPL